MPDDDTDISTPGFQLSINGQKTDEETQDYISSVTVEYALNQPAMFSFEYNMFNEEAGTWQGIDLEVFNLGDTISLSMGLNELVPMIEGQITTIEPIFSESYARVIIRGYDPLYKMRFGTRLHVYTDTTDNSVVQYLAKKSGLNAVAKAPNTEYPYLLQNNQSDYAFILNRARRIGYEILFEDGKLYFREPQEGKAAIATLSYEDDLESFSASLSALKKGSNVSVRGWDQNQKSAFVSTAKKGSEISKMGGKETGFSVTSANLPESSINVPASNAVSPADALNIAKGIYNNELIQFIEGQGSCPGLPSIRAGKNIQLEGLGSKFSGLYYITSASHTYNESGYTTQFEVKRTAV